MDLGDALKNKQILDTIAERKEVPEEKKKRIITEIITKGVYREERELEDLGLKVVFRTRNTKEEAEIRKLIDRDPPKTMFSYIFLMYYYALAYSLESINGIPVSLKSNIEDRLEELGEKVPYPIFSRLVEEFIDFERDVLETINPGFLQRSLERMQQLEQSSNTESSQEKNL